MTKKALLLSALAALILGCAVKEYPRPVTRGEKARVNVAHSIDTAGAKTLGGLYNLATKKDRQSLTIDYQYYLSPSFREDPRSFYPEVTGPPEKVSMEKIGETDEAEVFLMRWPSTYKPRNPAFSPYYEKWPETHEAWAVYVKGKTPNRAAIVVSHGWTGKDLHKEYKRGTRNLFGYEEAGYDALMIQQPYHGLRAPEDGFFSGEYFLSAEIALTNEAFAQTVTDARCAAMWLRERYEVVGAEGGSLGGITTLLLAAMDDKLNFAIAWVPPSMVGTVPMESALAHFVADGYARAGLGRADVEDILYVTNPANMKPAIDKEDILIFAGMGDNFVPPSQTLAVWEAWDRPPIIWFAGGHAVNYQIKDCREKELEFLIERLP